MGFERRVAWLEEDVAVLHRRLRDECNESSNAGPGAAGDSGLRALVARLDGELAAERRSREVMEARMNQLEDCIRHERKEREAQLRAFSNELETTMRGLIGRIDESLSAGAASMRERTDVTEARLRGLIKRVDEGLSAGAAALQDTLTTSGALSAAEIAEAFGQMGEPGRSPSSALIDEHGLVTPSTASTERLPVQMRLADLSMQQSNGQRPSFIPAVDRSPSAGLSQGLQPSGLGLTGLQSRVGEASRLQSQPIITRPATVLPGGRG